MKKTKHTEERIIGAMEHLEAGRPLKALAREIGITDHTLYNWKSKDGGMEVSDAKRLRALEPELVGASGFEPPASWSRTTSDQEINNLAEPLRIDNRCDKSFGVQQLRYKVRAG